MPQGCDEAAVHIFQRRVGFGDDRNGPSDTEDNIVIAGFILDNHNGDDRILVRGFGPSLTARESDQKQENGRPIVVSDMK